MQSHDEYRQPQTPLGYPSGYHLLINPQNSTHDLGKSMPAASSGMYAPNAAAMPGPTPQHHQSGQPPTSSMVQQQQMNHRPLMLNNLQTRPNPPMPSISRNPMGGVSQPAPQGHQQYPHVQNVMLQPHHNMHAPSMQTQHATPMMFTHPVAIFPPRPMNPYPQQQYFVSAPCFTYPTPPSTASAYFPMQPMQSCPATVNNIPDSQPPQTSKKKYLSIINPKTGEDILEDVLQNNAASDSRETTRSGGSDAAVKFASQVAAAVASKEPGIHLPSETVEETPPIISRPEDVSVSDSARDSISNEVSTPEICDQFEDEDEILSSRDSPSLHFQSKEGLELNSIDDIVSLPMDLEQDTVLPVLEVMDLPHSLANHEEMSSLEVPVAEDVPPSVEVEEEFVAEKSVEIEQSVVIGNIEETNCSLNVENEEVVASVQDSTVVPPQPDVLDAGSLASAGDAVASSKPVEETTNANTTVASKAEKVEGKKGKKGKKKDLNKKGESKEGSEMDAFLLAGDVREQDSTPTPASTPEVVPSPTSVPPPVSLPHSIPSSLTQSPVTVTDEAISEPSRETVLLNSVPPAEAESQPEDALPEATTPEETASPVEEFKKEDSDSVSNETPKITLKYDYKEDQWSPLNPEGKKQYDREFLLKLQSQPMSLKKPLNLPNLDVIKDKAQVHKLNEGSRLPSLPIPKLGMTGNSFDPFIPNYARPGNQKPPHPGMRRSQQGREKPKKVIAFSSSLNQSVKLHESENAWKPSHKNEPEAIEDEAHLQDLYKRVRGILNKLTPQKFDTLLNQVKELDINTEEKLNGVIDLVFEKAIDEPNFSVPYANMCKQLAMIKVPSAEKEGQFVNFRKLLLTKCQKEFEQDRSDEIQREEKLKQIEECDQADKKKQLQEDFAEEERKNRRRQLGNIRFIGELFKLGMLIEPIMHECIKRLLSQGDEDSLECLCRLLTTIGKELDTRKDKGGNHDMNLYFGEMQKIVAGRSTTSRVRFMLQDVIDLKSRNWIPRRDENNPKTIDQIHQEAEREAHEQQQMIQNMSFVPKRPSDDNRRKSSNTGRAAGGGSGYDDGWIQSSKGGKVNCNFDANKLKQFSNKQPDVEHIQLGPNRGYMSWGKGSSGGYKPNTEAETKSLPVYSSNRYGILSDQMYQNESRRAPQRSTASSRESSRGRSNQMSSLIRKTPSASKERENLIETVSQLAKMGQPPDQKPVEPAKVPEPTQNINGKEAPANANVLKGAELSREDIEKKTRPLMDEFLHNSDFEEAQCCIQELASANTMHMFVTEAINQVLERSSQARHMFGQLMHRMMKSKVLSVEQYHKGLGSVLEIADDYALDIPKIWEYLGEIIEPTIDSSNPESLSQLKQMLRPCSPSLSAGKLVSAILHCAAKTKGTLKVGELWKQSDLQWTDFLPPKEDVSKFIEMEKLEFTMVPVKTATKALPMPVIKQQLQTFLSGSDNNEEIFDWVEGNISEEGINEPCFVRALITTLFEHAITGPAESPELSLDKLKYRLPLLVRYVAKKDNLQLEALYAVQALMNQLGQPKGVLRQIFDFLYDDDIITEETFKKWEVADNPAEQEGKGVALRSVTSFFTWLREADEESEEG